ncbi:MAG: SocA family protein [Nitrospirae bacterium]|nr:SocA family protein [Nitrospirota bacterium]
MMIEHTREKLINAIIYFLDKTKFCGKTKLFKLLYYLDFMHFRETGKSVTGLDYFAWDFGPVPVDLFKEMGNPPEDLKENIFIPAKTDKSFIEMKPKKKFDDKYFTKRELRLLDNIAFIFKEAKAENMIEASHLPNHPWDKTIQSKGERSKIDYILAIDDTDKSLSLDEVKERLKDKEEIKKAFNG